MPATSKHECCCCPVEIRNLYAVAFNLRNTLLGLGGSDGPTTLRDLKMALEDVKPLIEKHFQETQS